MTIFISFSSHDIENASKIRDILEESGIETWMCDRSITIGQDYTDVIVPAIKNSDSFILLLSKEAEESPHVNRELAFAIDTPHLAGRIFPISFGYFPESERFNYLLKTIQIKTPESISKNDKVFSAIIDTVKNSNNSANTLFAQKEPQKIQISNISALNNGRYLYLGCDKNQFSMQTDGYFVYDKNEKMLIFLHLPDFISLGYIRCDYELITGEYLQCSPDGNYLLLLKDNRIWIANLISHKWIVQKKPLNIKRGNQVIYVSWEAANSIYLYSGKYTKNRPHIDQMNTLSVSPYNDIKSDLSKLRLCEVIGTRKSDKAYWTMFNTESNELIAYNPKKNSYNTDYWNTMNESAHFGPAEKGIDQFAPDNTTYYYYQNIGENLFLNICDTKEGILLLQMPSYSVGGITLLENHKVEIFDKSTKNVYIYDLKTKNQKILINNEYFLSSESFFCSTPINAFIDPLTKTLVFLVYNTNASAFRLVSVKNGRITAISDDCSNPYKEFYPSDMEEYASGIVFGEYVVADMSEYIKNGVNTYLFHTKFHRENEELIFD